ncbi:hypothetical protein [Bacillus wiedmannii]|uniref:hypothetical protein n=1 Tax=Bacillus wiedmannii TaxID=1890302 RepID=UPI0021CEC359|nr:hypothetical protein [Bacillus wiedmannii]MCU5599099.1 hypothetical protein [Bacillus wiedmannii]
MQGQIKALSVTVDGLKQYIGDLERKLSEKVDVTDIKQVVTRSEIIKKIGDSKSVGMDCKVGVSLDGRVVAESIFEHTADSIQGRVVKGSEINEAK